MTTSDNTTAPRLLLRPQEAANALGISLRTIMALVAAREIPHVRLGERNLRFPLAALHDWVAERSVWPTSLVPLGPEHGADSARVSSTMGKGDASDAAKQRKAGQGDNADAAA